MNNYTKAVSMDDLVFEGRNKSYGAYVLRKSSSKHEIIAIAIAIIIFVSSVMLSKAKVSSQIDNKGPIVIELESKPYELPEIAPPPMEEILPPPPPPPTQLAPELPFVEMVAVEDHKVLDKDLTSQKDLRESDHQIGFLNQDGDPNALPRVVEPDQPKYGSGPAAVVNNSSNEEFDYNQIFIAVQEKAEYPGGDAALYAYIKKNLRYPDVAMENGIEGVVVVEFVVDKDGSITNAKIIKEIGGGCGNEALRIINGMPKWKSAKQRDVSVKQRIKVPIKFKMS